MKKTYIERYWDKIESGEITACEKIKQVMKKLVYDAHDKDSIYEYNEDRASHAIEFIENFCKHSKGSSGGKPFILELWQKVIVSATFGFIHKIEETRKYRELILIVARKNGKSMLGSAIALYMQLADGESGPEVYSAATKRDQAKIIWSEAVRIIKKSPILRKLAKPKVGEIVSNFNDGVFRPLSSESNTLDGLNVHCSLIDELHAIEDMNLYDVIVDGMSAREQPLSVITTTAGTVRENIFDTKYEECEKVLNGYFDDNGYKDDRVLPFIYELDKRAEWTDPGMWQKPNPGLGTIKKLDILETHVNKALDNPLLVKNLLCKHFNVRETSSEAWLTFEQANNTATFDIRELKPNYGIGGCDLSSCIDLTAACILFKVQGREELFVKHMYWLPEDLLETRVKEDQIPYDTWHDMGLLRLTPGNKVHYKYITEWFGEMQSEYNLYMPWCGYDSWQSTYWIEEMQGIYGIESLIPVIQGMKTLSGPMKQLGKDLEANMINYENNPITKWCLTNTSIKIDVNDNIQPQKTSKSRRRIDGLAALLNAYVIYINKQADYNNIC